MSLMKKIQTLLVILVSSVALVAQTERTEKADKLFKGLAYVDAAKKYERLAKEKPTAYVLKKLGDSYYFNTKMKKASTVYQQLFNSFSSNIEPEYFFKYAQALRGIGDYNASAVWMKKFNQVKADDTRGEYFVKDAVKLETLNADNPDYHIKNLDNINSKNSDFGVALYKDTIIFASARSTKSLVRRQYSWNKQPFLNLYTATKGKYDNLNNLQKIVLKTNKRYHESSVAFSPDYQIMYFTRNNYVNKKYRKGKDGNLNFKIYRAERVDNEWKNIIELPFNSDDYMTGHPTVSADGKKLYFTSNMPGSIGKTDIYYVDIEENGNYGNPVNLGPSVNTEGREMFPNIASDNVLYFSSDGHFGLGALDVFATEYKNGEYTKPRNLKAPINSGKDDFAFVINPETRKGYLSSNRDGGIGGDDIYSVVQLKREKVIIKKDTCRSIQNGIVRNKKTLQPMRNANVIVYDDTMNAVKTIITDADGRFTLKVKCDKSYTVEASKENFSTAKVTIPASKTRKDITLYLDLLKEFTYSPLGDVIIRINPIYFDFNKANIRPDAARELDKVVEVMKKYPNIKIVSGSHTDSRGRNNYNEKLSDRRAKSTVAYIIAKGISPSRITGKGYGENQLVNGCSDGVDCSNAQHQLNRRTEFVVQFKR